METIKHPVEQEMIETNKKIAKSWQKIQEDIKLYQEYYANGEISQFSIKKHNEMEVLFFLTKLGYDINKIGTFYIKDLIIEIIDQIKEVESEKEVYSLKDFLLSLKDHNSELYVKLAKKNKISPEQMNILMILSKEAKEDIDNYVKEIIFGESKIPNEYSIEALKLATYIYGISKPKKERHSLTYESKFIK